MKKTILVLVVLALLAPHRGHGRHGVQPGRLYQVGHVLGFHPEKQERLRRHRAEQ